MDKLHIVEEKLGILISRAHEKIEKLDNGEGLDLQTITDVRSNLNDVNTLLTDIVDSYDSEIINGINDVFDSLKYMRSPI